MGESFEPEQYKNEYQAKIKKLIDTKIAGKQVVAPRTGKVIMLLILWTRSKKAFKKIKRKGA